MFNKFCEKNVKHVLQASRRLSPVFFFKELRTYFIHYSFSGVFFSSVVTAQELSKYKADTFDMIQNVLEENTICNGAADKVVKQELKNGKDLDNICSKKVLGKAFNQFAETQITTKNPQGTFLQLRLILL